MYYSHKTLAPLCAKYDNKCNTVEQTKTNKVHTIAFVGSHREQCVHGNCEAVEKKRFLFRVKHIHLLTHFKKKSNPANASFGLLMMFFFTYFQLSSKTFNCKATNDSLWRKKRLKLAYAKMLITNRKLRSNRNGADTVVSMCVMSYLILLK